MPQRQIHIQNGEQELSCPPFYYGIAHIPTRSFFALTRVLRAADLLVIEIVHDHWMPLRHSAVRHLVIHKGTVIPFGHGLSSGLESLKVAPVFLVVDRIVQPDQFRPLLRDIVQDRLFEAAAQIQIFQPEQITLILDALEDRLKVRDQPGGARWKRRNPCRL